MLQGLALKENYQFTVEEFSQHLMKILKESYKVDFIFDFFFFFFEKLSDDVLSKGYRKFK